MPDQLIESMLTWFLSSTAANLQMAFVLNSLIGKNMVRNKSKALLLSITIAGLSSSTNFAVAQSPDWAQHSQEAERAFVDAIHAGDRGQKAEEEKQLAKADNEAQKVLAEAARYNGKTPPPIPEPAVAPGLNALTNGLMGLTGVKLHPKLVSTADELNTYPCNLCLIADFYKRLKRNEKADLFYRKSFELASGSTDVQSKYMLADMILRNYVLFLEDTGKSKQAETLEPKLVKLYTELNMNGMPDLDRMFEDKATKLEEQGKFKEAETYWKYRVDICKGGASAKILQETKQENRNRGGGIAYPIEIQKLEDLARFYNRRGDYSKGTETKREADTLRQAVMP
jgi:hypothetical protein